MIKSLALGAVIGFSVWIGVVLVLHLVPSLYFDFW